MRAVLLALAILLLAPTASALVATTPARLDEGEVAPGATIERVVRVLNKGTAPTRVEATLSAPEEERIEIEPASLDLASGEAQDVVVRLRVAPNASGGRHDPRIELVEVPASGDGATLGRAGVSVPLVYWVSNLKVGNLQADAATPGAPIQARVLLQNFHEHDVPAQVVLRLVAADGTEATRVEVVTSPIPVNASQSELVPIPIDGLAPGAYTLVAEASADGRTSNARTLPVLLGERRLEIGAPVASVGASGRVVLRALAANVGTVPLVANVGFAWGNGSIAAAPFTLEPGASREVVANATLPPGAHALVATIAWDGGSASASGERVVVEEATVPLAPAALLLVLLGALALRRRRS